MATITFIGLGNMGGPMAANLVKAGHDLTVFDLSSEAVKALTSEGAKSAATIQEAVEGAEVVISMLPAGQHVEAVYLGDNGLLKNLPSTTLVIDSSTIAPETAKGVAEAAVAAGITFMDAPVSGGVGGAKAGTLTFICGGEAQQHAAGDSDEWYQRGPGPRREERPGPCGAVGDHEAEFRW